MELKTAKLKEEGQQYDRDEFEGEFANACMEVKDKEGHYSQAEIYGSGTGIQGDLWAGVSSPYKFERKMCFRINAEGEIEITVAKGVKVKRSTKVDI